MPAKSKAQQRAAGMALSAKRGDMDVSDLEGAAKDMYDSMTADELEDFAETEHKGLPQHVDKSNESTRQQERQLRGLIQKEIKEVLREIRNK